MLSSALISLMMNASGVTLPPIDEKQVFCLAENVYFEARDQSQLGQYAVTHVVLNRVRSDKFPDDVCSVIKQGKKQNGNMILYQCQFSWYCDGKPDTIAKNKEWYAALGLAMNAYMVYYLGFDASNGATFYHADYVKPRWSRVFTRVVRIDDHIFYTN